MEVHVMSKKNTRRSLDTSISYAVIGLDLAKADAAVAAVPCSNDEMGLIDRMDYATLFEQAEKLPPTLFAMEPCCGYSHICLRLQSLGHDVKVISGRAVKNWIATHKANQKTDLNDAIALAKLALHDDALTPIRVKSVEQCRMATVQTIRRQLRTQATKSLVCFKSTCQSWGIVIPRGSLSTKKMEAAIAGAEDMLGAEVTSSLKILLDAYKVTVQSINELDKKLDALVQNNEQARLMNSVLGIGTQTAARLATITGDIKRFQTPRSYVAYIGLAPRNIITGHCGTPTPKKNGASRPVSNRGQGKVSRNGDLCNTGRRLDLHAELQEPAAGMSVAPVAGGADQAREAIRQDHCLARCQAAENRLGAAHLQGRIQHSQSGRTSLGACGNRKAAGEHSCSGSCCVEDEDLQA